MDDLEGHTGANADRVERRAEVAVRWRRGKLHVRLSRRVVVVVASIRAYRRASHVHNRLDAGETGTQRLTPTMIDHVEDVFDIPVDAEPAMADEGRELLLQVQVDLGEPRIVERVPWRDHAAVLRKARRID